MIKFVYEVATKRVQVKDEIKYDQIEYMILKHR